jgi:hypothetical protein
MKADWTLAKQANNRKRGKVHGDPLQRYLQHKNSRQKLVSVAIKQYEKGHFSKKPPKDKWSLIHIPWNSYSIFRFFKTNSLFLVTAFKKCRSM